MNFFSNYFFLLVVLSTITATNTICSNNEKSDVNPQKISMRIKLGAYYFGGWSGKNYYDDGAPEHAWAKGMPSRFTKQLATKYAGREPIWGWREDKQEIMDMQIDLAADHGLSFFSFCWYWKGYWKANRGPINIEAINDYFKNLPIKQFMQAKNNNRLEFSLLVANLGDYQIIGEDAWRQAVNFWITEYFKHPRYMKVDGRPVIKFFSHEGIDKSRLSIFQEAAHEAGFPGVFIVGCTKKCTVEDGFQAQSMYTTRPTAGLNHTDLYPFKLLANWNTSVWYNTNLPGMPYIPSISAGWDRSPWEPIDGTGLELGREISQHFARPTPEEFEDFLRELAFWMDYHPEQITKDRLAVIYAWNEIGEGGWLVPCKEDQEGAYLKAIKNVIFEK